MWRTQTAAAILQTQTGAAIRQTVAQPIPTAALTNRRLLKNEDVEDPNRRRDPNRRVVTDPSDPKSLGAVLALK